MTTIKTGLSAKKGRNDLTDFGAALDELEALGCETAELPLYDIDVVVGGRIRRPQLETLLRATRGRPLRYTVHGPLAINFFDAAYRLPWHFEVLRASMEASAEIGALHYVMHAGLIPVQDIEAIRGAYSRQREWLAKAGELARDLGLYVCVENLFPGFDGSIHTPSPSQLARELASVADERVVATLDVSHAHLQLTYDGSADFLGEVAALAPFARHVHVHDSFGRPDDIWMFTVGEKLAFGHGDLHLPVGWGSIPWESLLALCTFPPDAVFNIELQERYWYAAQETLDRVKALARHASVAVESTVKAA